MKTITAKALRVIAAVVLLLLLYPVKYQLSRALMAAGFLSLWGGALFLWWERRPVRLVLAGLLVLAVAPAALPGRPVSAPLLRADYMTALKLYGNTRYVWGGENILGIDCSGLVRKGLVWGQIMNGVRTLNGTPVRNGISLWWHDCSVRALLDGYRGLARPLFSAGSINEADTSKLEPGDLAATANGIHIMVYAGDGAWLEADPDIGRVVRVVPPTDNPWFKIPVVLLRWTALEEK